MTAYYNEKDPFAAAWLHNLINAKLIAAGDVDERSIEDVVPVELSKYTQCHFFAGIGVWSYSLRRAEWPDERRVWTGSCPCQPFSQAGQGSAFDDERHLWPAFFHLIYQCKPDIVFGEQVASKDGLAWLDLVQDDMEGANYAFGALDICAAGFGAPHIRQRLYWMAYDECRRHESRTVANSDTQTKFPTAYGFLSGMVNNSNTGLAQRISRAGVLEESCGTLPWEATIGAGVHTSGVGNSHFIGERRQLGRESGTSCEVESEMGHQERERFRVLFGGTSSGVQSDSANSFWSAADWLRCKDDKWRPVEPGTFPLAHGAASRMGRLRGYGNAIVAPQAEEFIRAAMEYVP